MIISYYHYLLKCVQSAHMNILKEPEVKFFPKKKLFEEIETLLMSSIDAINLTRKFYEFFHLDCRNIVYPLRINHTPR